MQDFVDRGEALGLSSKHVGATEELKQGEVLL